MAIVDARVLRELQLSETKEKGSVKLSADQVFVVISDTKNPLFSDVLANTATFTNLAGAALPQLDDIVTANGVQLVVTARSLSWHGSSDRVVAMKVKYEGFDADAEDPDPPNGTDEATWRRITARTQQITRPARGWASYGEAASGAFGDPAVPEKSPTNTAGDPIEGLEEDDSLVALTYTNPKVTNPNFAKLNSYANTCNTAAEFLGGGQYTVRCLGWSGEYDEKTQAWTISVEFLYNPRGWQIEYYNVGYNQLVGGVRQAILDTKGNPIGQPVGLDATGADAGPNQDLEDYKLTLYPYPAKYMPSIFTDCNI